MELTNFEKEYFSYRDVALRITAVSFYEMKWNKRYSE